MLAVGICFVPCAFYMNQIFAFVAKPLIAKLPQRRTMIATMSSRLYGAGSSWALVLAIGLAIPSAFIRQAFVPRPLQAREKAGDTPAESPASSCSTRAHAFAYYAVFR